MSVDITDNPDLESKLEEEFDEDDVIIMGEGDEATKKH